MNFGENFPFDSIEPLSESDLESSFKMSVKEADQIRSKSQKLTLFQEADWKRLWNSIIENKLPDWRAVGMIF